MKKRRLLKLLRRALEELLEHDREYHHVTQEGLTEGIKEVLSKDALEGHVYANNPIFETIKAHGLEKKRAEHEAVWRAVGGMGVYSQEGNSLGVLVNIDHSLGVLKVDTSRHDRAPDRR